MMTDPIADLLTRIRNGQGARLDMVSIPHSRLKVGVAELLKREGFIDDVRVSVEGRWRSITVFLKYGRDRRAAIVGMRRVSRPGRRRYVGYGEIPKVMSGLGVSILSTSRGVVTDRDARAKKIGGELLCEVW